VCEFKPSFAVNAFCGLYVIIGIIDIIIYLDIGAPVEPTISRNFPSWHLFLLCFFNGLQWYGKRLSTKIANLDAAILNRKFPDDLRQIAKQGQSLAIIGNLPSRFVCVPTKIGYLSSI
jgi:hypothetical protein